MEKQIEVILDALHSLEHALYNNRPVDAWMKTQNIIKLAERLERMIKGEEKE